MLRYAGPTGTVGPRYRHDPRDPGSLCHDMVWHAVPDRDAGLWIGVEDGLCHFDKRRGRFRRIHLEGIAAPTGVGGARYLVTDPAGRLWMGTHAGLLSRHADTPRSRRPTAASDSAA